MAKRYTETKIWGDPWFQELPPEYKLFWKYLCDNCGLAGEWEVNVPLYEFQSKTKIDRENALSFFNKGKERIVENGNYWLILDFISFQYGHLNPDRVKFHKTIKDKIDSLSDRLSVRLLDSHKDNNTKETIGQKTKEEEYEEEIENFKNEVFAHKEYSEATLKAFVNYWSELNPSKTKMRFELEKTWETSKRLATWAKNERSFSRPGFNQAPQPPATPTKPLCHHTEKDVDGSALRCCEAAGHKGGHVLERVKRGYHPLAEPKKGTLKTDTEPTRISDTLKTVLEKAQK